MKAVELQGLTRRFKDKLAVDHVNLSLEEDHHESDALRSAPAGRGRRAADGPQHCS